MSKRKNRVFSEQQKIENLCTELTKNHSRNRMARIRRKLRTEFGLRDNQIDAIKNRVRVSANTFWWE